MYRCWDSSATVYEVGASEAAYRHDRAAAEQATELDPFSGLFSRRWNQADGGRLVVHHADCEFVCHDS